MRVIDFGTVPPLRSQSSWHALARCAQAGAEPTLSFVRPDAPYVCLGFHRSVDEVDLAWCRERGLPVLRRMVGGGPVYLDPDQCFFQITLPARSITGRRDRVLAALLAPAVAALQHLGVAAELDSFGEITVSGAKVCGHGAGQLRNGVVVVGNLIRAFDHESATRMLALDPADRTAVLNLMHRHVGATQVDPGAWKAAMVAQYAAHFASLPVPGAPTAAEADETERLDERLGADDFVLAADRPRPAKRVVKIRGGVYLEVAAA